MKEPTLDESKAILPDSWAHMVRSLQRGFLKGSYIRTVNYHSTPRFRLEEYEQQLTIYQRYFSSVSEEDIDRFFDTGQWHKNKPGLILNFFEGYRNTYELMAPLAEKYGFVGWFFIPTGFIDCPVNEQRDFANAHHLSVLTDDYGDGRIAMTWDEVRELDKKHVIASHTQNHERLTRESSEEELQREIVTSKRDLEAQLGHEVSTFCWLYGSEVGVNPRADHYLHEARYKYLLSNFKIQKIRASY